MMARTRYRYKHGGKPLALPDDHYAVVRGEPMFPTRVVSARDLDHVLIQGENNRKLGSHWLKGWSDTAIYSLSLPERSTCPRSCAVWTTCMGNRQQYTLRVKPDRWLIPKLRDEIANLASFGVPFSVRCHALGDFYSERYAEFWIEQIHRHQNLRVFGFTAHDRHSPIGSIIEAESQKWDRFRVRFSGGRGKRSSTVMIDPPAGRHGAGITCPVERPRGKAVLSCGACGLCLTTKEPIVFMLH